MIDLSVCTWSGYDRDGFLGIQAEAFAQGGRGITPFHHISPLGLDARPVDPQKSVGALCWRLFSGNEGFLVPLNDVRTEGALPNLNQGATRLFDTGTFGGFPFHFTVTLDPVDQEMVIESHRLGGKIVIENAEGLKIEVTGTTVKITGATSVECGGTAPLALAPSVEAMLNAFKAAVIAAASSEASVGGVGGMTALNAALSAWPTTVATTITKGA